MNSWLLFALLTPFLWGFSNAMDTAVRRHFLKSDLAATVFLAFTRLPLILVFFLIFPPQENFSTNALWMIFGGLIWMAPFILYYRSMAFEEASRVVLLLQLNSLFILIFAFFMIGERLSIGQIPAFILLLTGGVLAAFKPSDHHGWRFSKAFIFMLLAGISWSLSDVIFKKFEPAFPNFWSAFSWYLLGSFLMGPLSLVTKNMRRELRATFTKVTRRGWFLLIINQISGLGGTMLFAYALTLGKASLTSVFLGIQPLFSFLWTLILPRMIPEVEREDTHRKILLFKALAFIFIIGGLIFLANYG